MPTATPARSSGRLCLRLHGLAGALLHGPLNAMVALATLLTHSLLSFAPLGAAAGPAGVAAGFASVIVGGAVYALLGSARPPAGGPSASTALIVAGLAAALLQDPALAAPAGLPQLLALVSLAVVLMGLLQLLMAAAGLGRLVRWVPQPVVGGFMNGVAVKALLSQLPVLIGLPALTLLTAGPALEQAQPLALAAGAAAALTMALVGWRWPHAPAHLCGLAAGSAAFATMARAWPGAALGPQIGALAPAELLPDALLALFGADPAPLLQRHGGAVLLTALLLALMGSLDSLLVAQGIDQLGSHRHDTRRELFALGLANIAGGAFGALPTSLSRTRALPLIDAGATGRGAPLAATATFALLYAFAAPLLSWLPTSVLAGVMLVIAVSLLDRWTRQLLRQLIAGERSGDVGLSLGVVAVVCAATVAWGFLVGVGVGAVLSMAVFIRGMNRSLLRSRATAAERPSRRIWSPPQETVLAAQRHRVVLLELEGALFFGSVERLGDTVEALPAGTHTLVLDLCRIGILDASGAVLLQQLSRLMAARGGRLLLAGVGEDNALGRRLRAFGCFRDSPRSDWFADADRAVEAAERLLLADAGSADPQAGVPVDGCSLLVGLGDAQRSRVRAVLQREPLAAGTRLLRAGDPGDCLFLLTEGSVSVTGAGAGGTYRFVSFSPGVMLGEVAMLDGHPRSADAVADCDSVVYRFTRQALDEIGAEEPALAGALLRNIALHLAARLRAAAPAGPGSDG